MAAPRITSVLAVMAAIFAVAFFTLQSDSTAGANGAVRVELAEFTIKAPATIAAGRVTLDAVNTGKIEHELLIVRTDLAPDKLPLGLEGPALKLAGDLVLGKQHAHQSAYSTKLSDGRNRHILAGETRRDTVDLTPGDYVLLCNLPGHYEAGQSTSLRVR